MYGPKREGYWWKSFGPLYEEPASEYSEYNPKGETLM